MIIARSFMKQLKRLPQKERGVVSRTVLELQAGIARAKAAKLEAMRAELHGKGAERMLAVGTSRATD